MVIQKKVVKNILDLNNCLTILGSVYSKKKDIGKNKAIVGGR